MFCILMYLYFWLVWIQLYSTIKVTCGVGAKKRPGQQSDPISESTELPRWLKSEGQVDIVYLPPVLFASFIT